MSENRAVYVITVFLSAFLLFQVQLIIAKYVLPWYGGSASVWTTSLLFFQLLLLLGYAYSHLLVSRYGFQSQARIHLLFLAVSLLVMIGLSLLWGSPILAAESWKPSPGASPVREIFLLFSVTIGIPFLALSATSPLLQRWIGELQTNRSPYRLYAFSNLGSLVGLLSYPFLIEPVLKLTTQAWIWGGLYLLFALLCSACSWAVLKKRHAGEGGKVAADQSVPRPQLITLSFWFGLTFCSSTLLLAVTNQICQEVAVVPFLWVLPLSLYLLSFTICFHHERWYLRRFFLALMALGSVLTLDLLSAPLERAVIDQVVVLSVFLFAACITCHGELVRQRPSTQHLTSFYLMVALGGAAGGVFVGGLAPAMFTGYWELHCGILLAWLLVLLSLLRDKQSFMYLPSVRYSRLILTMVALAALYLMLYPRPQILQTVGGESRLYFGLMGIVAFVSDSLQRIPSYFPVFPVFQPAVLFAMGIFAFAFFTSRTAGGVGTASSARWWIRASWIGLVGVLSISLWSNVERYYQKTVTVSRNFYGISKVVEERNHAIGPAYSLYHGQTLHGLQPTQHRRLPTTYFGDRSGIGTLMLNYEGYEKGRNIGILGLGIGTLAVYATPGDKIRFYEINPEITRLANGEGGYFSYLEDSPASIEIVEGDARTSLEREVGEPGLEPFDILVLDVFSSDSIPMHLLTKEAFGLYLERLKPNGVLAVHITNRFLDLKPVVAGIADAFGLHKALVHDFPRESTDQESTWFLLSSDKRFFDQPPISLVRSAETDNIESRLWTDNFSNLFEVVKF